MKKILIFSLAYFPKVGGAEIALKEITDRARDFEFHMVTLRFPGTAREERIGNVHVHRVGSGSSYLAKILFIPRAVFAARALHEEHRFDAFWAMMSYMLFPVTLLRLSGVRVPHLLTLQEGDPFEHMFRRWFILPFLPILWYGFRRAGAVQAISTYLSEWARRMGYRGEVSIVPNGVDVAAFSVASAEKTTGTTLVTTSRLVRKNAVDDVIRALKSLPSSVRFVVYGEGVEESALRSLAERLGVADRALFKGEVPYAKLPQTYAGADIFVRPSRSEGMGNSFIEAMAAGLPIIGTQEGGIADFLFDEKRNPGKPTTGWAVDKESPEQIADAVKEIMTNPVKAQKARENAFRLVKEKYDWNMIAKQMGDIFARLTV